MNIEEEEDEDNEEEEDSDAELMDISEEEDGEEVDEDKFKDEQGDAVVDINSAYLDTLAVISWNAIFNYWVTASTGLSQKMKDLSTIPEDGKAHFFKVLPDAQKSVCIPGALVVLW